MGIDAEDGDAAFEAEMARLRQHYHAGLSARRAALDDSWRNCADAGDEAPWLRLRDVAHKLSGSAPSYGFDAVGAAARELDRLLSGRTPCRERGGVQAEVASLSALLEQAIHAS